MFNITKKKWFEGNGSLIFREFVKYCRPLDYKKFHLKRYNNNSECVYNAVNALRINLHSHGYNLFRTPNVELKTPFVIIVSSILNYKLPSFFPIGVE